MSSATKRAWKLDEFAAHVGNVNCLSLGHKSGRVMVSGGDDKKVNMWAVGKPTCILSLSGHTSPVDAVKFNSSEDTVIAGSLSGALKIWDLESVKILRTLTGHKSSVRGLDFHPYGNYVASGSADTNIKLWDMRRRGCIYTYKGHTNCVNFLRFSPDGKWIASAGEDGLIKLWDLGAGKQLSEFRDHTASVTVVKFHPNEFFLASGSVDRTVKFWDLESMQLVCSTDGDCTYVRTMTFHPDGLCLYCGCENQLKVYGWEPATCFDTLSSVWSRVSDIAIAQQQLIGASFSQSNISVHVVDIERVRPLGGMPAAQPSQSSVNVRPQTNTSRRSFVADRPDTRCGSQTRPSQPKEEVDETSSLDETTDDLSSSVANVCDPEKYQEVFQARHQLSHSPPVSVKPFPAPVDDGLSAASTAGRPTAPVKSVAPRAETQTQPDGSNSSSAQTASARLQKSSSLNKQTHSQQQQQKSSKAARSDSINDAGKGRRKINEMSNDSHATKPDRDVPVRQKDINVDIRTASHPPQQRLPAADISRPVSASGGQSSDSTSQSSGLIKAEEFLQKHQPATMMEDDVLSVICTGHKVVLQVLGGRSRSLQLVKAMWSSGNIKTATETALQMCDTSVMYDILNLMLTKSSLWNLDLCVLLLPVISDLIASKHKSYVCCGLESLKHILRQFTPIIKANISAPPSASVGVDISREERYNKCMSCYRLLKDVRSKLDLSSLSSEMTAHVRELRLLMTQLDDAGMT